MPSRTHTPPPYERFEAWRRSHELALTLFQRTESWPARFRYSLTEQLCRAGLSVPTNIVEGCVKRGAREFARYLGIAHGSLHEVGYLLRFARDLLVIKQAEWEQLENQRAEAAAVVWGLLASMRRASGQQQRSQ